MLKKSCLIFGLMLMMTSSYAQEGWYWQNPLPQGHDLHAVWFADADTGWAVGYGGTVLFTADGGENWDVRNVGTDRYLFDICFRGDRTSWAVGGTRQGGVVLKTTDGGQSWSEQNPGTVSSLYSVFFIDQYNGWAVGYNGTIVHTADGGENWNPQTSATAYELESVYFVDDTTGWAVGNYGYIIKTIDGGEIWNTQASGTTDCITAFISQM